MTFHLVLFAWIFFRAHSLADAWVLIRSMFVLNFSGWGINVAEFRRYELMLAFGAIFVMELTHYVQRKTGVYDALARKPVWVRWAASYALIFGILMFGEFNMSPFIYFQF